MPNNINPTLNASTINNVDYVFISLITLDQIFRYYGLIIHGIYLTVLIFSSNLRAKTLLYVNHATVVNASYILVMFGFMFGDHPTFNDKNLNNILCSISEFVWIFSQYIRSYSLLSIAIYRYLAVFKVAIYKKMNDSNFLLISPLLASWIFSIAMPEITKYALQTTYSYTFCLDGYSEIFINSILYFVINFLFVVCIPTVFVIAIYIIIIRRLNTINLRVKINNRSGISRMELSKGSSLDHHVNCHPDPISTINHPSIYAKNSKSDHLSSRKQKRFANQFIYMCVSIVASDLVLAIFSLRSLIPNFFNIFYYVRPVLRILIVFSISLVPIVSLYYNPCRKKFIRDMKKRFLNRNLGT